jgi:hypothetical protein
MHLINDYAGSRAERDPVGAEICCTGRVVELRWGW